MPDPLDCALQRIVDMSNESDEMVFELERTEGYLAVAIREAGRARDALRAIRRCVNSSQVSPEIGALIRQTVHDGLGE